MSIFALTAGFATVETNPLSHTVVLAYDTDEPLIVQMDFGYSRERRMRIVWEVARDVLAAGLLGVAGLSDVCCWTSGEAYLIRLSSPEGQVTLRLAADDIRHLLIEAEDRVPYGHEDLHFDEELTYLLKTGGGR